MLLYQSSSVPFPPFTKARTKSIKEAYSSGGAILKPLSDKKTKQPLPIKRVEQTQMQRFKLQKDRKKRGYAAYMIVQAFIFPHKKFESLQWHVSKQLLLKAIALAFKVINSLEKD